MRNWCYIGVLATSISGCTAGGAGNLHVQHHPEALSTYESASTHTEHAAVQPYVLDELNSEQRDALDAAALIAAESVVTIRAELAAGAPRPVVRGRTVTIAKNARGCGIVIGADGWIVTSAHVFRDSVSSVVILPDGTRLVPVGVWSANELDLAIVKIDAHDLPVLTPSSPPLVGAAVVAVAKRNMTGICRVRRGIVTNTMASLQAQLNPAETIDYGMLIESTAKLQPGFSGGPLLDRHGRLIGLNVAMLGSPQSDTCRGYALSFNQQTLRCLTRLKEQADASVRER